MDIRETTSEQTFEQRQVMGVIAIPPYRVLSREPVATRGKPSRIAPAPVTDAELEAEFEERRQELEQLFAP